MDYEEKQKKIKEEIIDMVEKIEILWILETIHNFIIGMIKEGD